MNIVYKGYEISQASTNRFNLEKEVMRTRKDSEEQYPAKISVGYDMKLETCMEDIISEELWRNNSVVTLKTFLSEYKREKEELIKHFIKLQK